MTPLKSVRVQNTDGTSVRCEQCGTQSIVYFWIDDAVWLETVTKAGKQLGCACPGCIAGFLGRPLTLDDLSIANYQRSNRNNGRLVVQEAVRTTIIGACREMRVEIPAHWSESLAPNIAALAELGRDLARHTPHARASIARLVHEANTYFPIAIAQHEWQQFRFLGERLSKMAATGMTAERILAVASGLGDTAPTTAGLSKSFYEHVVRASQLGWISAMREGPVAWMFYAGVRDGLQRALSEQELASSMASS